MNIPENLHYTHDHEWLKVDGNIGLIGVTDYAQGELGDIVYLDIPENISEIKKGESCGTIEAVKTVSEILAPVSGKVIEVNRKLNDSPEIINKDPYNEGWILKIEISNPAEINELLDPAGYAGIIE
ncbi:MAG: glycine cleavage system protein GcvH [Chloroherpetonaceae bacterium]|jgi:glycine cleavage system H protein|nr:glycine cleavage system protein GcvH [bacterium]